MFEQTLSVSWVAIDEVFLSPSNPRVNDEAVPHVAASIRRFGFQQPMVAKRSGEVIAGNVRWKAAKEMGLTEVPVVWFEGSDLDATAYQIADNRTHEYSSWDQGALGRLLEELRQEDALDGVGYSVDEIDELLAELEEDTDVDDLDDPGPTDPPEKPVSRRGDLWILGDHRLLCGDSTELEDVHCVMAGEKAAIVATDPPYLVDYTGERPNDSGKDWTATYREVDIKDAEVFFRLVFTNIIEILGPHAAVYCWHAHKRQALITSIWEELGLLNHQQIIWVKPTAVFGRAYWHFKHEPCLMGWRQGQQPEHDGHHEFNSVWEIDWEGKQRIVGNEHPTQKPVELFVRPIKKHTRKGAVCFEPFSGSGSQLIAAEKTGRRCRAIEISEAFVDVAVRRWQEATGKDAVLHGSGGTFAELCQRRSES
ncbi:MAG: DNA modification methylase [Planctomycetota bacterium]|jgi:DNA modification methylase